MPNLDLFLSCKDVVSVPPTTNRSPAILDSGATGTFITPDDAAMHLHDITILPNGPTVLSANGTSMRAERQGRLSLSPHLSTTAQSAFVLDDLQTGTLVSLSQLCDDDCIAIFTKFDVQILKNNQVIIIGHRMSNGLWTIPISSAPTHQANGILRTDSTKMELAAYLHATLGSPVPSTLIRAIRRGHLTTFPGLTTNLISKHLSKSVATVLGHQDQEAKNLRSTRSTPIPVMDDDDLDSRNQHDAIWPHRIAQILFGPNRQIPDTVQSWK